ncbi:hypothetical protein DM860_007240 [Cuscuta australis]|uniref:Tify domain-containing protein n=1 Tax=Cuscuta australis TaxID=267555 RepID=A0A328E7C0_9ASTE|nr:hypothetical protein DM860_007240 [Cuscuta australis]
MANHNKSSIVDPKRSHQWFMGGIEPDLPPNKKQDVDKTNNQTFTALMNSNISPWMNFSSLHSIPGQYSERVLDGDQIRELISYDDRNLMPISFGTRVASRKLLEDSLGSDSSFGLSIGAESLEDPSLNIKHGGIAEVKLSQRTDTDKFNPTTMGDTMRVNSIVSPARVFSKADNTTASMRLSSNIFGGDLMSMGDMFQREDNIFISMGQLPINKINSGELVGGHSSKEKDCYFSHNQSSLNKDDSSIAMYSQTYRRGDRNITSMGQNSHERTNFAAWIGNRFGRVNGSTASLMQRSNEVDKNNMSMSHTFQRGETNIISFGGLDNNDEANVSGRLLSSYDLLKVQSLGKRFENARENRVGDSNVDTLADTSPSATLSDIAVSKRDEQEANKKSSPNSFPSNVRSLLSTGIFDGVPVKYIAWSREKELRGVIKGTGYLCGCQSCNFSETINAYEFERHAGCKTKHPNNHIYFVNGKTVYGIVQELRNTHQDLLFEVIQTVSGSPVNQKSFHMWKGMIPIYVFSLSTNQCLCFVGSCLSSIAKLISLFH